MRINGFTLLEIMVAVSIVAIVLVAVFRAHIQALDMNAAARFHTVAPALAQKKIAELEMKSQIDQGVDAGNFGAEFSGYAWTLSVEPVQSEILEDDAERLKKIDVIVSLDTDRFVYHLRAYRLIPE